MASKTRIGLECKNVLYVPRPENQEFDLHLVKVNVHYDDGSVEPALMKKKNYERKFWIAKRKEQNYNEKKERMHIDKLDEYKCPNFELEERVKYALEMGWYNGNPNRFMNSQYLFGTDMSSSAMLKTELRRANSQVKETYSTVAVYDIETNVLRDHNGHIDPEVIISSLTFKDRICTTILKKFVKDHTDVMNKLKAKMDLYLGDFVRDRNIKNWDVHIFENETDVITFPFQRAHEWRPDFITIWNIDYDIPMIVSRLEKFGIDPKHVFSDPSLPDEFKYFNYKQGKPRKTSNKGVTINFIPAERWHVVECPASFYLIDSMCVYQKLRVHKGKLPSYALDAILDKEFSDKPEIRKLKFEEASHIPSGSIEWHQFMQERYPLEYVIYNVFDCISVELLDEKILDLAVAFPKNVEMSDFSSFPSQPSKLADQLWWFNLDRGYVYGTSGNLETEYDKLLIGLDEWIVTLPAHLTKDNGLKVIEGAPEVRTNIRVATADADVTSSYPNSNAVFNTSRETTEKELITIEGVSERDRRMQGINLCGGQSNAIEIVTTLFNTPNLFKLDKIFKEQHSLH